MAQEVTDIPTTAAERSVSVDDAKAHGSHGRNEAHDLMVANAKQATENEHKMTLMQGVRLYPKAVAWSMLISTCIVMEGYDVSLIGNFFAFDGFNRKFGELTAAGTYEIPARWQSGMSNGAQCGQIIGLILNGWASERFGYRFTILASLVALTGFITIFFMAQNVATLVVAEVLCGIPWGVFQTLCITYASEVCPVALRGYLTCYVNFCWGLGQVIGVGVIKSMIGSTNPNIYRLGYALQWVWPLPLFIVVAFAPESPWWLVRKGKIEQAKKALLRLTSLNKETNFNADETISMMQHTTELEKGITTGSSYLDCFRGTDLRRTEIVCLVWAIQNLSGNSFSNYSTYFLVQAGLDASASYSFALGQYGINMVGVFGAWTLMALGVGRRRLFIVGLCGLCTALMVMGFLGLVPDSKRSAASMATGVLMLVWALFYQCSVGTIAYSLVAEMSTRRLQIKTVVIGRALYNVVAIICNTLTPYMLNPTAWNWQNYAGFFWGVSCFCCIIYCYFRLPEVTGRSFAEIDLLFERKIPARQFAKTDVNAFDVDVRSLHGDKEVVSHQEQVEKV